MKRTTPFAASIRRAMALSAGAIALSGVSVSGTAAIVCSTPALPVPQNIDGVYINLVTGATGSSGSAVTGWDFNPYASSSSTLLSFNAASGAGYVSAAGTISALSAGTSIGPSSTYLTGIQTSATAMGTYRAGVDSTTYLGFRLTESGNTYYAWLDVTTTGPNGLPMTLNSYCYDNTGAAIAAGDTGAPATPALALATSGSPSTIGDSVTFTATLSGNGALTGAGNVTFCADAPTTDATCGGVTPLCTEPASTTTATCATSGLTVGSHSISAYFSGDANNTAATAAAITQVVNPPPLSLTVDDGSDFAAYGQIIDYTAVLSNSSASAISGVSVMFTLSAGLDGDNVTWACDDASCVQDPGNPLHYTVTVPANGSVTWQVGAPVLEDTEDDDVTFSVVAGKASASDVDTLVIFRDGFDVASDEPLQ